MSELNVQDFTKDLKQVLPDGTVTEWWSTGGNVGTLAVSVTGVTTNEDWTGLYVLVGPGHYPSQELDTDEFSVGVTSDGEWHVWMEDEQTYLDPTGDEYTDRQTAIDLVVLAVDRARQLVAKGA